MTETPRLCQCGCEAEVAPKRNYRPGHDQRHVSAQVQAAKDLSASGKLNDAEVSELRATLPTDALRAKFDARLAALDV